MKHVHTDPDTSPRRWCVAVLVVVLATVVSGCSRGDAGPGGRLELRELAKAMAQEPERPIEGRLAGFKYAPPPVARRGARVPSVSPDTKIAAARLEKILATESRPANWAAVGVAFIVTGELTKAIDALEEAVAEAPTVASYQSDLSAAYIGRASAEQRADDWAPALAAANRAIRLDRELAEARFNRALALRGLHLGELEATAWREHSLAESSPDWLNDAAAISQRGSAGDTRADQRQTQRESAEAALSRWAAAERDGRSDDARSALDDAQRHASALEADDGDTLAADEVRLIQRLRQTPQSLQRLIAARVRYDQSEQYSERDNFKAAADLMATAATDFASVGSAYAHWAPIAEATFLRHQKMPAEALRRIHAVSADTLPEGYHNLRGRFARVEGVLWGALGRYDLEREPLRRALAEFEAAGEIEQALSAQTLLAEVDWFLGDASSAWANVIAVLTKTAGLEASNRRPSSLSYHLTIGATIATGLDLPEAAIDFMEARVSRGDSPRSEGFGYMLRGRLRAQIGDDEGATKDLARAAEVLKALEDPGLREEAATDIAIARAELLQKTDCRTALRHADSALPSVRRAPHSIRIVGLLAVKARCRQALGDLAGATADLADAAASFESRRASFPSAMTRIQAFEEERQAFKALIALEAVTRQDERAGLRVAERGRAGVLAERWSVGFDATEEQRIPAGVAVVYFESLDDRTLTWVLTHDHRYALSAPLGATRVRRMSVRLQREIADGADAARVRIVSAEFSRALLHPALQAIDSATTWRSTPTIVFVPDSSLYGVPFSALPDVGGEPLVRTRTIAIAPSLAALHAASRSLAGFTPSSVLAIGDGHDPRTSGLPRLPRANDEAMAVGRQYPNAVVLIGEQATKSRILRTRAAVMHFAGHTVINPQFPAYSRLLLAPDRDLKRLKIASAAVFQAENGKRAPAETVSKLDRLYLEALADPGSSVMGTTMIGMTYSARTNVVGSGMGLFGMLIGGMITGGPGGALIGGIVGWVAGTACSDEND
jgi:CHAT domain-containing protein